jgi:hypothetical protein
MQLDWAPGSAMVENDNSAHERELAQNASGLAQQSASLSASAHLWY